MAKAVLGLLDAGVHAARHRARRRRLRHPLPRRRAGARASPCSPRWPTCSPTSTRPTRRWRWSTAWRSCPATPAAARRGSRLLAARRRAPGRPARRAGTGGSSRPGPATPPSARWPPPSPPLDARRVGRHHVRRGHRPRLHRRRPHHRLHQQGVRGARPPRLAGRARRAADARGRRPPRPAAARSRARGATRHDLAAHDRRRHGRAARTARRGRRATTASTTTAGSPSSPGRSWPTTRPRSSTAIDDAIAAGADPEQLGRAVAYAAALRITRFHTQNDHGDWDEVHHAFTAANALHQALGRAPTPELLRGVVPRRAAHLPRPVPQRPRRPAARACADRRGGRPRRPAATAGTRRAGSTRRARSSTATSPDGGDPARPSPRSASAAHARTPSSTGSRPTRRRSASSTPGPPGRRRAR